MLSKGMRSTSAPGQRVRIIVISEQMIVKRVQIIVIRVRTIVGRERIIVISEQMIVKRVRIIVGSAQKIAIMVRISALRHGIRSACTPNTARRTSRSRDYDGFQRSRPRAIPIRTNGRTDLTAANSLGFSRAETNTRSGPSSLTSVLLHFDFVRAVACDLCAAGSLASSALRSTQIAGRLTDWLTTRDYLPTYPRVRGARRGMPRWDRAKRDIPLGSSQWSRADRTDATRTVESDGQAQPSDCGCHI